MYGAPERTRVLKYIFNAYYIFVILHIEIADILHVYIHFLGGMKMEEEKEKNPALDKDGKPKYPYWNANGEEVDRFGNKVEKEKG